MQESRRFENILIPLDGSKLAEVVLPLVERLAAAESARVTLLHVLERGAPATIHGERHLRELDEAEAYLREIAERLEAAGIESTYHAHEVPEGDVARSIVQHADEEGADLIAIATHGSGRVRQLLFGSIAQQVLQRGTVPVLLARPPTEGGIGDLSPGPVLVPLDGTRAAEDALDTAADLARALGQELHLVMVVATPETVRGDRTAVQTLLPASTRAALDVERQDAVAYLDGLAERLGDSKLTVTTDVRRGGTASALTAEAEEHGVGIMVVATHGRAGLQAIWAGSVGARLLARTRAPILLLRTIER
ncbi:MAG TPA: universal stress protein [Chloroflexota bacterium]|nr:universal stress protein [Chloroflexota bacterium]